MFEPKWLSFYFFAISAFVQFSLFIIEAWLFTRSTITKYSKFLKFFGLSESDIVGNKDFLVLAGFNHLFISIVIISGLLYVLKLQPFIAGPISALGLLFTIIISIVYLARSKKYLKVALIQLVPATSGFAFLISHILPAIRAAQ